MTDVATMRARVARAKQRAVRRDQKMLHVASVRRGESDLVWPEHFSEGWPKPVIANFIDTVARDLSEVTAPLPAFTCSSGTMASDRARKFAEKRTKIVNNYYRRAKFDVQMLKGADWYYSFGFLPIMAEPDFNENMPFPRVVDPMGSYYGKNRLGDVEWFAHVYEKTGDELAAEYPEYRLQFTPQSMFGGATANTKFEVTWYCDRESVALYATGSANQSTGKQVQVELMNVKNRLGKCWVRVAERPSFDDDTHGQFDDVLWIQLAKDYFARLALEAAEKSVQAPLAVPEDVTEISFGPDAVLRTREPDKVRRVGVDLPTPAFQQMASLESEQRVGARYPEARSGQIDASIVTGRGVQALLGGFDSQVKSAQLVFARELTELSALLFEMDETYFGHDSKEIRGVEAGTPYAISYIPTRDINGDHTVEVRYGLAAGLDPNRALVFLLQLRGDNAISQDTMRRELPLDLDVIEEERKVQVEQTRQALQQALAGYVQALPVLVQNGADPTDIINKVVSVVTALQSGQTIEQAAQKAFAPVPPPAAPGGAPPVPGAPGSDAAGGGGPDIPQGMNANGLLSQVANGQAGLPPGGRPDIMQMLAGLNGGGAPTLNANVARRIPIA